MQRVVEHKYGSLERQTVLGSVGLSLLWIPNPAHRGPSCNYKYGVTPIWRQGCATSGGLVASSMAPFPRVAPRHAANREAKAAAFNRPWLTMIDCGRCCPAVLL